MSDDSVGVLTSDNIAPQAKKGFNNFRRSVRMPLFFKLCADEHGQDLTEYALILCVIALAVIVILGVSQGSVTKIWGITQNNLDAGVCSAVVGTS